MRRKLINFFNKPTSRHIMINTLGNYLNVFFVAFFFIILTRVFNRTEMGVYSVLFGISYVLANILDFGTTATIYSYLPSIIEKKAENLYCFIKSTFHYQSLFSFIVIIVLFITFPYLDKVFFKTQAPIWELHLTTVSVLFFIWQNFVLNILFAAKKFFKANLYLNLANIIKTLVLITLIFTKKITVGSVIFTFGVLGPIIFFTLLLIEKKDLFFVLIKAKVERSEFRFGYTLTNFIALQFFNLGLRMDLFLLSYFISIGEVGDYGVAQKIILTVLTTVISITQVMSPAFSRIKTKTEVIAQFKHAMLYMFIPIGLFILLAVLPDQVFFLILTDKFPNLPTITRSLGLSYIIYSILNIPQLFLLYTVKKPSYILYASIVFFIIVTVGCYIIIPQKGVFGPPLIIFAAFIVQGIILSFATLKEYLKISQEKLAITS